VTTPNDHASTVAATITDAALCWRCIGLKAGVEDKPLDKVLVGLREGAKVALAFGLCDGCQRDTLLYRLVETPATTHPSN
jgi:hypothetical protein